MRSQLPPGAVWSPREVNISEVAVIIPAHNEEKLLPECLEAVSGAVEQVGIPVRVLVVLDRCADGTADICRQCEVDVVRVDAGCVGLARAGGTSVVLADHRS